MTSPAQEYLSDSINGAFFGTHGQVNHIYSMAIKRDVR